MEPQSSTLLRAFADPTIGLEAAAAANGHGALISEITPVHSLISHRIRGISSRRGRNSTARNSTAIQQVRSWQQWRSCKEQTKNVSLSLLLRDICQNRCCDDSFQQERLPLPESVLFIYRRLARSP